MNKISSLESFALSKLKKGKFFFTTKMDKDITAIAGYYKKKIKTERLFAINHKGQVNKITKVTIL